MRNERKVDNAMESFFPVLFVPKLIMERLTELINVQYITNQMQYCRENNQQLHRSFAFQKLAEQIHVLSGFCMAGATVSNLFSSNSSSLPSRTLHLHLGFGASHSEQP